MGCHRERSLLSFEGAEWSTEVELEKTIDYVKALALEKFEALKGHKNLDLKLDGTSLMDPMSLADYPQMKPGTTVRFECSAD